jgi:AraC-like DNA-binding protein
MRSAAEVADVILTVAGDQTPLRSQPFMFPSISLGIAVLGLFIAPPLFILARKRPANVWLGLFVFEVAWLALAGFFFSTALFRRHPNTIVMFHWAVAGMGPAYYCYVRSLIGLGNGMRQAWHFLPQGLLMLLSLWSLIAPLPLSLRSTIANCSACAPGPSLLVFQLCAAGYACGVLWRLDRYRRAVRARHSSMAGRDLRWLQWNTGVIVLLLALWGPASALGGIWSWLLLLGQLAMFYLLGWYGLQQQAVFVLDAEAGEPVTPAGQKYARSGMTEPAQALIGERLARRMAEQRDFLHPDIKLLDLAASIGNSPQLLSQYLNEALQQSFFDYLNEQRTLEVQNLLRAPDNAGSTLLEVAFAAGFNSKTTFNASFKKLTGMAPSAWRKRHGASPISDPAPT